MIDPLRDIAAQPPAPVAETPQQSVPVAMGKALVAIKDSAPALHAFAQALEMSRRLRFPVAAVTVAPTYEGDLGLTGIGAGHPAGNEPARMVLDAALDIAVAEGLGLETFRATGPAHLSILEMVRGAGYGLVVLGRGRGWTSPFNVAVRVAHQSPVDVLVIPQGWTPRFSHLVCGAIGVALDPVLDTATHLASLDGGRVTLFSLANEPVPAIPSSARVKVETVPNPRELYLGLRDAARRESTDMVVFAEAPSPGFLGGWAMPRSIRLLRAARCPLWVVKV